MGKIVLTIILICLAGFIIISKEIPRGLKTLLILCLFITEILVLTMLF